MFAEIDKIHDHSYFIERLNIEQNRLERFNHNYSIVRIQGNNGSLNNSNSAMLLNTIGNLISPKIRKTDTLYVGNNNIFILLANTNKAQAKLAIKKFSKVIIKEKINVKNLDFQVSNSADDFYSLDNSIQKPNIQKKTIEVKTNFLKDLSFKQKYLVQGYQMGIGVIAYNTIGISLLEDISDSSLYIQFLLKRLIDIIGSIVGLILFSPLFLLIFLLIKISSQGPILFKQERIGYQGDTFILYKFRTLRVSHSNSLHKQYIDTLLGKGRETIKKTNLVEKYKKQISARITWAGKILRKTSLDELPQLWNVLKGDMSLVGPRPHPIYEIKKYQLWYYKRLQVLPGITGLSKIHLRCTPVNYDEAMRYDIRYAENWNLMLDIKIILYTIPMVLLLKNSY